MTKRKTVTIIIIIAAVLLVGYIAVSVVVPRVMLHKLITETLSDIGDGAEYFTEYSVAHREATFSADNGHIMIDIPERCVKQDMDFNEAQFYKEDNECMVILLQEDELDGMNLLDPENFDNSDYKVKIGLDQLTNGIESFGNGLPDSAYGTWKCSYMLDEEDYNPWNLNNQVAYSVVGVLKMSIALPGEVSVYERDDICGFVSVAENADPENQGKYNVTLEIFTKDNLNKSTAVMVTTNNIEDAYAVMNSARPVL